MTLVLQRHIAQSDDIRSGKPHTTGTRITVSDVVTWHFRMGVSLEEIAANYDLTLASVYAAVAYYYDHQANIDQQIEASLAYYQSTKEQTPSLLKNKLANPDHD